MDEAIFPPEYNNWLRGNEDYQLSRGLLIKTDSVVLRHKLSIYRLNMDLDSISRSLGELNSRIEAYSESRDNAFSELTVAGKALSYIPIVGGILLSRKAGAGIEECIGDMEEAIQRIPDIAKSIKEEMTSLDKEGRELQSYQTGYAGINSGLKKCLGELKGQRGGLEEKLHRLAAIPDIYNIERIRRKYEAGHLKKRCFHKWMRKCIGAGLASLAVIPAYGMAKERLNEVAHSLQPKTVYEYRLLEKDSAMVNDLNERYIPVSVRALDIDIGQYALAVDKSQQKIYIYQHKRNGWDFIKSYGVSTGKIPGPKSRKGDGKTPSETTYISQIQDSSSWRYGEFGYGPYFLRLGKGDYSTNGSFRDGAKSPIGIHGIVDNNKGNGNDEAMVGTPRSHGCIRLKNKELLDLMRYAKVGTPVVVRGSFYNGNLDDLNMIEEEVMAGRGGAAKRIAAGVSIADITDEADIAVDDGTDNSIQAESNTDAPSKLSVKKVRKGG